MLGNTMPGHFQHQQMLYSCYHAVDLISSTRSRKQT